MIGYDKRYAGDPQPVPDYDFTLPDGYTSVFNILSLICVVENNTAGSGL